MAKVSVGTLIGGMGLCVVAAHLAPAVGPCAFTVLALDVVRKTGDQVWPNLMSDLFTRFADWTGTRFRNRGAAAKNHDLRTLLLRSVENVLNEAIHDFEGGRSGLAFLKRLRRDVPDHLPRAMEDVRFEGIRESDLVSYFQTKIEDFDSVRVLDPALWTQILNESRYASLDADEQAALHHAASALHERLPKHLVGMYRDALSHDPTIFVAVQTAMLQELWSLLSGIDDKVDALGTSTNRIQRDLVEMRDAIRESSPNAFREVIEEFRTLNWTIEWLVREQNDLLREIGARVGELAGARRLAPLLEQAWLTTRSLPFHYSQADVTLHGRFATESLEETARAFLDDPAPASWWLWTGLEGAGKSRLAMETCRIAKESGWDAGFLTLTSLRSLRDHWHDVRLSRDTLVVCDYVGLDTPAVHAALNAITFHADPTGLGKGGHRLRFLLLERHSNEVVPTSPANLPPQWCVDLFQAPGEGTAFLRHQYPSPGAPSLHIGNLDERDAHRFARACVAKCHEDLREAGCPGANEDIDLDAIAARVLGILGHPGETNQWRPLHIRLTAYVLVTHAGSDATFEDVITTYLRHRVELRKRELEKSTNDVADVDRIVNLVCVATVLREVAIDSLPVHSHLPGDLFRINPERLMSIMGQPANSRTVQGLEPDLIGEWFVRLWCSPRPVLGGRLPFPQLAEILDQIPHSNVGVADFVHRTYRYPEFRDHGLWKRLRSRLGRYSTPFGQIFDSRDKQYALLGGTTRDAEHCYASAIDTAIEETVERSGDAILVNLMAGGSERCRDLLERHPHLRILAIDRDVSRLRDLEATFGDRIHLVQREIDGAVGLGDLMKSHFDLPTCDVVIAKKALHEIGRESQVDLIRDIGSCLRPRRGRCILYADSPESIDDEGLDLLEDITRSIRRDEVGTARGHRCDWEESDVQSAGVSEDELEEATRRRIESMTTSLTFDPDHAADAAVFANMWILLKDWANYNVHECIHRYFSSRDELERMFADAGLQATGPHDGVHRFHMQLQATRFVEDAINRIGYMCADSTVTDDDLRNAFEANPRIGIFRRVVEHHLWDGDGPSAFGRSPLVRAAAGMPFDLDTFVQGMNTRLSGIDFESVTGPMFEMPVHVFCLTRQR